MAKDTSQVGSPLQQEDRFLPNKSKVLCVDDDPRILGLRATLLSIAGYEVLTATNAESALQLFRDSQVDLVITEYVKSGRDWEKFVGAMKSRKPEVPILLYTVASEPPEGFSSVDRVLAKGMNPSDFLSEIANLIARSDC